MAANTNQAIQTDRSEVEAFQDVASIATHIETSATEVLIALAKKQLESQKNKGKVKFIAVVTKVLEGHTTDLFLNEKYEIDRLDGVTKELHSGNKVVLLHVPAVYTYYENQTIELKNSQLKNQISVIDLYKVSCVTNENVKPNQVVNIEFEDITNFKRVKITTLSNEEKQDLSIDTRNFVKAKEIIKKQDACLLRSVKEAEGYAIKSKAFLNPANPKYGYVQFYQKLSDLAKKDNVLKSVAKMSSAERGEIGLSSQEFPTVNDAFRELTDNTKYKFSIGLKSSPKVVDFIESNTSLKPSEKVILLAADTTMTGDDERLMSLTVALLGEAPTKFKEKIADYLESIVVNSFKYTWSSSGDSYKIDIFGGAKIDNVLKTGNADLAIEYSKKSDRISRDDANKPSPSTVESPQLTNKSPNQTSEEATNQANTPSQPSTATPVCDNTTLINDQLYINVEKETNLTSFAKDNQRYINDKLQPIAISLETWFSDELNSMIFLDYDNKFSKSQEIDSPVFSYKKETEVISGSPEVVKQNIVKNLKNGQKPDQALKTLKGAKQRGTNADKVIKNLKKLVTFSKELTKLIATNEGLPINKVYVYPISVYREWANPKPESGQDENSRHFFGRAMDFTVYVNYDEGADLKQNTIPKKGTYEIPNTIVYLYVLALIRKDRTSGFGTCGLGLLSKGTSRSSGYVHYEYMGETSNENVGLLKNRRWVSQPNKEGENTVYGKAFGQRDTEKDKIIKDFVFKDVKAKTGIIPQKIQKLL